MKLKIKNGSHRYDITRPRPRPGHEYSKYEKCLSRMMYCLYVLRKTFEAQYMKKLSNTEAGFEKSVAYKKACISICTNVNS